MATYFEQPYPARAAIGVNELSKDAQMDGVLVIQAYPFCSYNPPQDLRTIMSQESEIVRAAIDG